MGEGLMPRRALISLPCHKISKIVSIAPSGVTYVQPRLLFYRAGQAQLLDQRYERVIFADNIHDCRICQMV